MSIDIEFLPWTLGMAIVYEPEKGDVFIILLLIGIKIGRKRG